MVDASQVVMANINDKECRAEIMLKNNPAQVNIKFETLEEVTEFVREIYKRGGRR